MTGHEFDGIPCPDYPRLILAHVVKRAGFSGLARCVPSWEPGFTESRLNEALKCIDYNKHPDDWFRVKAARDVARRIRKPINDDDEFFREATWALVT
jgi:hypothetical protein